MRGRRLGTCFLELVTFIPIPTPEKAIHRGASERPITEVFSLTDSCVERLFKQGNVQSDVHSALFMTLGNVPVDFPCSSAIQVPIGISQLFFVQKWKTLAISPTSKWDSSSDIQDLLVRIRNFAKTIDGCSEAVAFLAQSENAVEGGGAGVNAHNVFALLARDLLRWCDSICSSSDDPEETQNLVHRYVLHLNTVHENYSKEAFESHIWDRGTLSRGGGFFNVSLQAFGQYRAGFLLECVLFSLNLRRSGSLKKALTNAARCLPAFWSSTLQELLQSGILPSEATVSRARLFLDVSFMMHWRRVWKQHVHATSGDPGVLFLLAASSPQGQQNWLMIETFGLHAGMAARAMKLFEQLYALQLHIGPIPEDVLEKSLALVEDLRSCRFHHVLPPTALGPRHATLAHKTHALLHSLRLESESWAHVQQILGHVISITSDQGVEMGLNSVSARLDSLFPYWLQGCERLEEDTGIAEDIVCEDLVPRDSSHVQEQQHAEPDPECVSLRASLFTPGLFHIVDGITKEALNQCNVWPDMKVHFESALSFFHMRHRRTMFVQSCLSQFPELRGFKNLFETGPPLFEGGRAWGVLQKGISWLLRRERPIRQSWSADRLNHFGANNRAGEERDDGAAAAGGSGVSIAKADEALGSDVFWGFLHLLQCTADALDAVFQWIQSCPCHPPRVHEQLLPLLDRYQHVRCPMRGLRAPELCSDSDSLMQHLDSVLAVSESGLMAQYLRNLDEAQQALLLADWSKLASFIKTSFTFKLSPWKTLPLLIVGLGHGSLATARRLIWQALGQYENLSDEQKSSCHDLTRKVFSPSLPLRQQVERFLRGANMTELPELSRLRVEMAFIPILEQSIERRHAMMHQRIQSAHNHSGPYVSIIQRSSEIEHVLSEPGHLQSLADFCTSVRTPPLVIRGLGLQLHPEVAPWFQASQGKETQTPHKIVAALVYRCDASTQFSRLTVDVPPPKPGPCKRMLTDCTDDPGPAGTDRSSEPSGALQAVSSTEECWQQLLLASSWDHFRKNNSGSSVFFSMAPRMCGAALSSLEQALIPDSTVPQRVVQAILDEGATQAALEDVPVEQTSMALEFEDDDGNGNPGSGPGSGPPGLEDSASAREGVALSDFKDVFFFRLLTGSLHRRKRARTDTAEGLGSSDVIVQHHRIREVCWEAKEVLVYLDASGSSTEHRNLLSHPESLNSLLRWQLLETKYMLKGGHLPPEAATVLDEMWRCEGQFTTPASSNQATDDVSAARLQGLRVLERRGCVECIPEENGGAVTWRLKDHMSSQICAVGRVGRPCPFATARQSELHQSKPANMTLMELMLFLKQEGFAFECWSGPPASSSSESEPPPFNLHNRAPKTMLLKAGAIALSRLYLLALAEPTLKQHGVASVRHCQPDKYYSQLLAPIIGAKEKKKKTVQALTFQVDAGIAAVTAQAELPRRMRGKRKDPTDPDPNPNGPSAIPEPAAIANASGSVAAGDAAAPGSVDGSAKAKPKAKPVRTKQQHEKSHKWGAGYLTFKPPNAWQATCHRKQGHKHTLGKATRCTRTRSFARPEDETDVLRRLRFWLNTAGDYANRVAHMNAPNASDSLLASPDIDAQLERNRVPDDYDSEQEGPSEVPVPETAADDEAASDPDSDSSSSSSSRSADSDSSSSSS